ncbi:hypothetical protein D918_04685 [Trichuris suis]|nr:hypothetical protein D918_04685 [Trichuris suis]
MPTQKFRLKENGQSGRVPAGVIRVEAFSFPVDDFDLTRARVCLFGPFIEPLFNENPTAHLSPSAVHWSVAYVVLPTSRPILYCYPVDQVGRRDNNANGPTRRTGWPHGDIRIRVDDDPAGPSLFHSFCHCPDVSPSLVHYLLSPTIFGSLDCSHPSLRAFASSTLSLCAPGCASPKSELSILFSAFVLECHCYSSPFGWLRPIAQL